MSWTPAADAQDLQDARQRGYVTARRGRSLAALQWRQQCQRERRAYVRVRESQGLAEVELDLSPARGMLTAVGRGRVEQLAQEFGVVESGGHRVVRTTYIPRETAHAFAVDLLRVLAERGSVELEIV